MSIRQKILYTLAVSLTVAFIILGTAMAAVMLEKTHNLAEQTSSVYGAMMRNAVAAFNLDKRANGEQILQDLMPESGLISGWILVNETGHLVTTSFREGELEQGTLVTPATLAQYGVNTKPLTVMSQAGAKWVLHVSSPEWKYLPANMWLILLGLFIGMAIVMGVVYGVMESLVIGPLASLAAASRLLKSGVKPPPIPAMQRRDEVGELVRSFQSMAEEVLDYRHDIEQKVEEETSRRAQAEHGLVLAQRVSATSRLAAGIAHEINNPLAGVMNALKALQRGNLPEEKEAEYLDLIDDGLTRINEIVQKMLTFQRTKPSTGLVPLAEVAETAITLSGPKLKMVRIDKQLDEANVTGDKGELVQAVLNLILNSADALIGIESPRLTVKTTSDNSFGVITVADNGCGITSEVREHVFDLFYSGKEGGTGLGLAITQTIIENHGGRIAIESTPGKGTTMTVRIPLAKRGAAE
jgi:signal transduction histidine kinase